MNDNPKGAKNPKKPLIFYYAVMLLVLMMLNWLLFPSLLQRQVTEVGYDEFISMVDKGQVETIAYDKQDQEITFEAKNDKGKDALYKTGIFPDDELVGRLLGANVKFAAEIPTQTSPLLSMLISYVVPIVLIIAVGQWLQKKMMKNMGGNMMSFGKSNAKIYAETETGKTFADVAGQDEAKEALTEIVDFLHNPNKYASIGAKLPKGALLVGPPGTGKTLLAKAVAGEAHVPFFSISGSEFVEMFVGMGAAKVRDLFKQASEKAPCIVFIDEIDTIGKKRDGAGMGGNDEREQTLNQLLTEMDGFDGTKGVVILAATNRPESLDPALLRPGRFDRRIPVQLPDLQGRIAILKVHAKDVHMSGNIDFNCDCPCNFGCVRCGPRQHHQRGGSACRSSWTQQWSFRPIWRRAWRPSLPVRSARTPCSAPRRRRLLRTTRSVTHWWLPSRPTPRLSPRLPLCRAPRVHSATPCRWMRASTI